MANQPVVTVQEGQLRGKTNIGHRGSQYFSFQGIPYAKPPVGELRFKAPQPAEPWSGILNAITEGNECLSHHMILKSLIGSEDCLFLNVFTPELPVKDRTKLKPVMVWIHGGGFTLGSGNAEVYGPDFLIEEDVVIVTINYRLGFFGFLNFDDATLGVPGNAGLKDQVMALKWVQNNIIKFNGDRNNVTIFGESAGGASVHYLMLSPMAKGLFHRAIMQSGSAFEFWAVGQKSAPLIRNALGLTDASEKKILNILQEMSGEEILELHQKFPDELNASIIRVSCPVVETFSKQTAFLPKEPADIILSGVYNKVPLIIGYTSREGMVRDLSTKLQNAEEKYLDDFESVIPHTLNIPKGSQLSKNVAAKIKNFYYGDNEPSLENKDQYYVLHTDIFTLINIYSTIAHHLPTSSPIYLYRMSVESSLNILKSMAQIKQSGVCHGDDIGYLFKNTFISPVKRPHSIEDIAIRRFVKLWTTFARNGDPNPTHNDPLINVVWKPVQEKRFHFLDIGENLTIGVNPDIQRMQFWDEIRKMSPSASKVRLI